MSSDAPPPYVISENAETLPTPRSLKYSIYTFLSFSRTLLQQLLCLVDLCRQIRASSSIRMVQKHHLPVLFPYHVFRDSSFSAIGISNHARCVPSMVRVIHTMFPGSKPLLFCSSLTRSHPCRMHDRGRWCHLCISSRPRDLRDPVWLLAW